jgi:hypothetical protein
MCRSDLVDTDLDLTPSNKKEIEDAEEKIRTFLGYPCASDFQQQFESQIDPAKREYLDRVGKTEWISMPTEFMLHIQQREYRCDWASQSIYEMELRSIGNPHLPPTGEQFYRQLIGAQQAYTSNQRQQGEPQGQVEHTVLVNFRPTKFTFPYPIKPPYLLNLLSTIVCGNALCGYSRTHTCTHNYNVMQKRKTREIL